MEEIAPSTPLAAAARDPSRYEANGGEAYHAAIHGGLGPRGFALIAKRRAAKLQPFIDPTDSVLEYGVGPGWNLAELRAKSLKGFDVATSVRDRVESQGIEFLDRLTAHDSACYDVIVCSHVLEHLANPVEALTRIAACLRPGGRALIFVPFDFERRFRAYDANDPNHHLFSWNVQSLSNLVQASGFTVAERGLRRFGYERIAARWVERLSLPDWMFTVLISAALAVKPAYELAFVLTISERGSDPT